MSAAITAVEGTDAAGRAALALALALVAAELHETSTIFAARIGWLFLGDWVGARRRAQMGLIATGAVIGQPGG